MKNIVVLALLGSVVFTGCARHYNIILTNNHTISTTSKPKLNKTGDAFVYKDHAGKLATLPAGSVKTIEPQSSSPTEDAIFKPGQK